MQGFALADEVLLFRQKDPKPLSPVRGPPGASASVPNKMARELAALKQPSPRGRFGTEAPPRPTRGPKIEAENKGATLHNTSLSFRVEREISHIVEREISPKGRNDKGGVEATEGKTWIPDKERRG